MSLHGSDAAVIALLAAACAPPAGRMAQSTIAPDSAAVYRVYVANESSDIVSRVAFSPQTGAYTESRIPVGPMVTDVDGPHGITVSPDGQYWYVSLAHGTPFGRVWKFVAGADTLAGSVDLGLFPATMATTHDGQFLFVVNFNLHGDMVPSSVSVVFTRTMTEVARPQTCVMPHGSRLNEAGSRQYSTCMMSEQLVELDTRTFRVTARFSLVPGREAPLELARSGHGSHAAGPGEPVCSPTWAQPGRGAHAEYIYVACNGNSEVLEIDTDRWGVTRRFTTGKGPYNLAITPDGKRMLVTLKADRALMIVDLETGATVVTIPTTQPITHGVVVSPDARFAFVTNEAIGSTRGTLDVIDLASLTRVASTALEFQPGGIDFWSGH